MTNVTIKNNSTKQEEPVHKVGNWYHLHNAISDSIAVLTVYHENMHLVCPDGDYWEASQVTTDTPYNITEQELTKLCGKDTKYTLLKNITITVE